MYQTYKSLAKYYDLIFQGKDYVKETSFINSVVRERNKNAKSILDVGCGTGTHLNLLVNDFKILYGVDLNREMIQQARKKSKRVKYVVGGMKDFHIKRKFDVLTCLFAVFNYNLNEQEAKKTLKNFRKHLNTNGVLVLALYIKRNLERKVSIHCGKKKDIDRGFEPQRFNITFSNIIDTPNKARRDDSICSRTTLRTTNW